MEQLVLLNHSKVAVFQGELTETAVVIQLSTSAIDEEDEIDDQEEEHLGSDNEEREQDEDDDANVTDNEDSPTNVAAETTNDAPTNEFDDGY